MAKIVEELESAQPVLNKAVFSQPTQSSDAQKHTIRPVRLKGKRVYQLESFRDGKAFHQNLGEEALLDTVRENLEGHFRQVLIVSDTESRQYTLRRDGSYKKTSAAAALPKPGGEQAHNREKEYLLKEGEAIPALVDLGVFTADYRIVRSRYDKFRQINRFVELVAQGWKEDGRDAVRILDFGCGKSYLTFILYYYFSVRLGWKTEIIGYDLKADVVETCNAIARRYGYEGLRFQTADVTKGIPADAPVDMVVTLHACDVATDYALAYAMRRKIRHIFSVPCCQHEVNLSIHRGGDLDLLLEYGLIRERTCALLTDAVRTAVLESAGYETDVIEFVDFEHSPKNLMLRARYTGRLRPEKRERAEALQRTYGFRQTLLELTAEGENSQRKEETERAEKTEDLAFSI